MAGLLFLPEEDVSTRVAKPARGQTVVCDLRLRRHEVADEITLHARWLVVLRGDSAMDHPVETASYIA